LQQYGDYKGKIQLDGHDGPVLHEICQENGIDSKKHFPIGFSFYDGGIDGLAKKTEARITIYTIDKSIAGNSFDEVQIYIKKNDGQVNVDKFDIDISYSKFFKYFKRCSLFVLQNGFEKSIINFSNEDEY
jgi:hypothetical protein